MTTKAKDSMLGEDPVASATAAQTHKVRETLDHLQIERYTRKYSLLYKEETYRHVP